MNGDGGDLVMGKGKSATPQQLRFDVYGDHTGCIMRA